MTNVSALGGKMKLCSHAETCAMRLIFHSLFFVQLFSSTNVSAVDFDRNIVRSACTALECHEPNVITSAYFAQMAQNTGRACIVHIFPERSADIPWQYWREYLSAVNRTFPFRAATLYALGPKDSQTSMHGQALALRRMYLTRGTKRSSLELRFETSGLPLSSPYRQPHCHGRPVLELTEGARIVSDDALSDAERTSDGDRAERTVLVVVDY